MPTTVAKPRTVHRGHATIADPAVPGPSGADRPRHVGTVTALDPAGTVRPVIARAARARVETALAGVDPAGPTTVATKRARRAKSRGRRRRR